MPRRLPPLNALRAFEAAARHGSFTRAALELHVTQAAVSHQVKHLEDWLSLALFDRLGHSLRLTAAGRSYLGGIGAAFDRIAAATEQLASASLAGPLRITALPSFTTRWLLPRLGRFQAAHPEIELHIASTLDLHDFGSGDIDIGIRLGLGRWSGLQADLIAHEYVTPLCSAAFAGQLHTPSDLRGVTLLHDDPQDLWPRWLAAAGLSDLATRNGANFGDSSLLLQATGDGQGVGLGRLFLAADEIAAGRLVQPFALALQNDFSYWLVYPKANAERPRIAAFRRWLLAEAGAVASSDARVE